MTADHREPRAAQEAESGSSRTPRRGGDVVPGSLAALDSTLPPTPLKDLLAADGASIFVLTEDVDLVAAVQQAGGEQYPVHAVGGWSALVDVIDSGRCHIVLLDVDAVPSTLGKAVDDLQRLAGPLVVLVAAKRDAAQPLMSLLSERRIHRLLIKPAAVGITRLLLESAVSRYLQLREQIRQAPVAAPRVAPELREDLGELELGEGFFDDDYPAAGRRRRRKSAAAKWPMWVAAAALAAVAIGVVTVGGGLPASLQQPLDRLLGADRLDAPAGVSPSTARTPANTGAAPAAAGGASSADLPSDEAGTPPLDTEVAAADAAASPPPGAAATTDAATDAAGSGTSVDALFAEAEAALLANDVTRAAEALDDIRRVQPSSGRLAFLDAQLERARAAASAATPADPAPSPAVANETPPVGSPAAVSPALPIDAPSATDAPTASTTDARVATPAAAPTGSAPAASPAPAPAAPSAEVRSLLTLASRRLEQDQLLQPAGDSARVYVERAAALEPDASGVAELRARIAAAVADTARIALVVGNVEQATVFATAAAELDADPEVLAVLNIDLEAAQTAERIARQSESLAAGTALLDAGRLIAPEGDNALEVLAALRLESPDLDGLAAPWNALLDRIAANVRSAVGRSDWQLAERYAAALSATGAAPDFAAELAADVRQAQFLASPAPTGTLRLVESAPAFYPPDALRTGVQGWVDLDFIVGTDGRPHSVTVVDSQPGARFNDAAIDAINSQRYEPFELDGRRYERRLNVRIRFTLE